MTWKGTAESRGYGWLWKQTRKYILTRDNGLCIPCQKRGKFTPATEVDHIIPKAKGGSDDHDNLQSICTQCHNEKTIKENGGTLKITIGENGEPQDKEHPWNQ
jgi:5-methylcytosine-specific restriction protein A